MALKKIVTAEGRSFIESSLGKIDIGVQETKFLAICRVASVQGDKRKLNFQVDFQGDSVNYSGQYSFEPSVSDDSLNFIKQAYLYLKTLPEFDGAVDC